MSPTLRYQGRLLLLLLAAALLGSLSTAYFVRSLVKPVTGLVVNFPEVVLRQGHVVFSPKTPFSPAVAGGLQPERDRILSIAGRKVQSIRDVVEADARVWGFRPLAVEVLRDERQTLSLQITPVLALVRPDWIFAFVFCAALGFMAFYLILRLPQDSGANLMALAALFYLVFTALKPFYYESLFSNLLIHLGKLTAWFMVLFALHFPQPRLKRAGRLALLAGILVLFLAFTSARLVCFGRWAGGLGDEWYGLYRQLGQWGNIADGAAFLIYVALLVYSYWKTSLVEERRQIEWILAGFLIGVPPYFFLDQLPLILGEPPGLRISMGGFANLFLVFVPLMFLIGLIRHRGFSLRLFFLRYLLYFCLLLLLFAFFLLAYEPAERFVLRFYGLPPRAAAFLVTALLFLALVALRSLVGALLERLLFPSHYAGSPSRSAALEARNRELKLLLDELNRQKRRNFQTDRLRDLRAVLSGIIGRIGGPAESAAAQLAEMERAVSGGAASFDWLKPALEAARGGVLEIREFLRKLGSLTGIRSGLTARASVEALVRDALLEVRRRHLEAPVRIEAAGRSTLVCHPEELVQAFRLLLENSLEAAQPPPQVVVHIHEEEGKVRIRIEDNGPGIEGVLLKRLFEPFVTSKPGHEGLGLYLCRSLVERNSGSIEIRSTAGTGTAALLIFPSQEAGA
jgi:signal transduction histidine kinase